MNIAVLIKEVPDTEARLNVKDWQVDLSEVSFVINPYDEYALEEALRIKDASEDKQVKVFVLMVGRETSRKNLLNCLALGADEAILIADPACDGSDPLTLARILAKVLKELSPTLVFAGKQGVDFDWGLTAIAVANELGYPHVGVVKEFKPDFKNSSFKAVSEADEGELVFEGRLPAVITAEKGLNEPRYASLKGIMGAKKKPMNIKNLADLDIDAQSVGSSSSKVKLIRCVPPPEKPPGKIIQGETVEEKVKELIRLLHEEAKVI